MLHTVKRVCLLGFGVANIGLILGISPAFGVEIECNQAGARFQMIQLENDRFEFRVSDPQGARVLGTFRACRFALGQNLVFSCSENSGYASSQLTHTQIQKLGSKGDLASQSISKLRVKIAEDYQEVLYTGDFDLGACRWSGSPAP